MDRSNRPATALTEQPVGRPGFCNAPRADGIPCAVKTRNGGRCAVHKHPEPTLGSRCAVCFRDVARAGEICPEHADRTSGEPSPVLAMVKRVREQLERLAVTVHDLETLTRKRGG